jgi:hypothetical protein
MPNSIARARLALIVGGVLWLVGWGLVFAFPQLPDGDSTARQQFVQWYGMGWQNQIRHAWWWNLGGAVLAWGLIGFLFSKNAIRLLALVGLLIVVWWGYGQTIGWQGELFLAPNSPTRLADSQTIITFEQFTIPPAPDGAGRALQMQVVVNGQSYTINEATPYRGDGWTVRPKWYGAVVAHPLLEEPLYIGVSGTTPVRLRNGREVSLTVNVETLSVTDTSSLSDWTIDYYAIVTAQRP